MEGELLLDALFEGLSFFEGQGVGFCDNWDDVDNVGELPQDRDINGFESEVYQSELQGKANRRIRMTRRLNKEKTAVDTSILNVSVSLGCELFSQVC